MYPHSLSYIYYFTTVSNSNSFFIFYGSVDKYLVSFLNY